ncbi:TIGR00266 family protein [candidate division TA06 bacterium]|uniref:TIGR00266 family protein n=1 Tax=candidate division TA06 bacterium TaxID=2250710 RepID=A0A523UTE9_UNCT6|nr:MAG: TIGR00266 family protein [candidate division TA06 bacterium]
MEHEVLYRSAYALLRVKLEKGEAISAEAGAMVSMSSGVALQTTAKGGLFGALKRSVLGGESFFLNTFTADEGGEMTLAPTLPGDVLSIELRGETIYAQSGAYIASSPEIRIDTKWGGARTFFSREGLFLLKISGTGKVFLSSYGAIHEIELSAGQKYVVDTGHMVAWTEGVAYNVKRVGGLKSTLFSGEGLVCELTGPGKIMIQSRSADAFLAWLIPQIPKNRHWK